MTQIRKHLSEVSEAMTLLNKEEIDQMVMVLEVIKRNGGTVYLFGNGGSHATASHMANDLVKMAKVKAMCVGDMSSSVFAYGNDNGWRNMFSDLLRGLVHPKDGLIGISCSGMSENVLEALAYGAGEGILTIGMTGPSLSSGINNVGLNALVHVMAEDIRVQEDLHLMVAHAVVRQLQQGE